MRSLWKGSISFGLIQIPISLFAATRREELKFRLLRSGDLSPVNYKRVAEADGKEVPWDQIVKGYEYEKDRFVVLNDDDFKRVDIEATQTVEIIDFVLIKEINPIFFNKPFYMEPAKTGAKAYVLLREALRVSGKVGIAKVVIKTRQHLAAVKPNEQGLVLELMHFADELLDAEALHFPPAMAFSKGEMEMARTLIDRMTSPWKPERYQDDYKNALVKLIEEKARSGGKAPAAAKARHTRQTNVIDLVQVLQQSLDEAQRRGKGTSPGKGKTAAKQRLRKAG